MSDPKDITIAFLLHDLSDEYSSGICQGAIQAAKELGISVIFFVVGSLKGQGLYSSMRNKLFPLIEPKDYQGIMYISSTISNEIGTKKFFKYVERYEKIPTAHIGIEVDGKECFNIDNFSGMNEIVTHMIEVHNRRRIAFINGTRGVQEADDRFSAYKNALKSHGIAFDEQYVYDGKFVRENGILAIKEFLDVRKIKMDALIGANDLMTSYAMKELQKRGYKIPEDISIGGFDDRICAITNKPALTTIHQPIIKLGYTAVHEFILQLMTGNYKPSSIQIPVHMKIRESCGCQKPEKDRNDNYGSWISSDLILSKHDELDSIIYLIVRDFIGTFEESEIRNVLKKSLEMFNIKEFSLAKYIDSTNSTTFYSTQGNLNCKFQSKFLVKDKIDSFKRPFYKFVLPLFYRNEDIGFFISDPGSKVLSALEFLRYHLSGALKGANLLSNAKLYAEDLEKRVKEEIEKRERQKSNLFINLSHEIKTPLTLVNNYFEKYIQEKGVDKDLLIIQNNLEKINRNIINFFEIEKINQRKIVYNNNSLCCFSEILNEKIVLFNEIAKKNGIIIKGEISDNIFINIDPVALDRLINNLIENALKFTNEKGSVEISLKSIKGNGEFIVSDTGIGILKEEQPHIFETYYQVSSIKKNNQGIGLGLSIVKNIIDQYNLKIRFESEVNKGTTFVINFKSEHICQKIDVKNYKFDKPFDISISDLNKEVFIAGRNNILLVEDNIDLLNLLSENISKFYNTFHAINGKDALMKIANIPKPDLILSDIMMDEMDGYEFYKEILKDPDYKEIPFIFLTARESMRDKLYGLSFGAIDYISKPFNINEIIAKINSLINNRKAQIEYFRESINKYLYDLKINGNSSMDYKKIDSKIKEFKISDKEKEVLLFILKDFEYKEIANKLNVSINTIRTHVRNIYKKCSVNSKYSLMNIFK